MEPKTHAIEKENHLPNLHFKLPAIFWGGARTPYPTPRVSFILQKRQRDKAVLKRFSDRTDRLGPQ